LTVPVGIKTALLELYQGTVLDEGNHDFVGIWVRHDKATFAHGRLFDIAGKANSIAACKEGFEEVNV